MARKPLPEESGRPTIKDVAALAHVSPTTVSRVLSGDYPVAASTRSRVMRAIRELDYVVNAHARALSGTTPRAVAFVLNDITGPSFAHVAKGVELQATAEGRLCLVCTTHGDPDRELAVVEMMRGQSADAVILVGGGIQTEAHVERLTHIAHALDKAGSRLVLCGRPPLGTDAPVTVVEYDNEGGAFAITSHLLSAGHRKIVFLGAMEAEFTTSAERISGFVRAHQPYGITPDPATIVPGDFTRESGYESTQRLLALGADFTAVFAATDMVAVGALRALREAGLDVPGDVSVVGYDDIPLAQEIFPPLTTVHVPHEELGRTAVRLALHRNSHPGDPQHVVLGTHVAVRQSVAAPPAVAR